MGEEVTTDRERIASLGKSLVFVALIFVVWSAILGYTAVKNRETLRLIQECQVPPSERAIERIRAADKAAHRTVSRNCYLRNQDVVSSAIERIIQGVAGVQKSADDAKEKAEIAATNSATNTDSIETIRERVVTLTPGTRVLVRTELVPVPSPEGPVEPQDSAPAAPGPTPSPSCTAAVKSKALDACVLPQKP
ncbi:MAG: hypothetical protein WAT66_04380 [Actinomycetota bacterium]